jgi:V/A-type H+-transporting ATPase subunit E
MSETDRFTDDIMAAAKEKARIIISEAETQTHRALDEAKAYSARDAEEIMNSARAEAEGLKRRQISDIRHRLKLHEESEKSKIVTEVLDQTKKRVTDALKDDKKYLPYLTALAADGIREIGLDTVVIRLNSSDLKRINTTDLERDIAKSLRKPIKIEFSREPIEALGGAVISSKDGRTRIVNTLDQRFEALESKLLIQAAKILFGE